MNDLEKEKTAKPRDNEFSSNLRVQIRSRLQSMKLSIRALERKANVKIGSVSNILSGASTNPSVETVNSIAKALECSIDELLNRKIDHAPQNTGDCFASFQAFKWNPDLFSSIVASLNKQADNRVITSKKALQIIHEIYLYYLEQGREKVDDSLIEWLLKKTL